ncbi:hypothetical protein CRE_25596 [Caenorhabditis remanei]|uniref:Fungal lipase-type domain-containing protein n=1 Tax=Caenorhabditis remanei TaxID=31234 RepID=E3LSI9_CAERE|nr:hypothetical protein CRE_25596 [Caenorhabditis remanei]
MPASPAAYLLLHLFLRLTAKTCYECLIDGGQFCLENNKCIGNSTEIKCEKSVDLSINCPSVPALQYAYDDEFVRYTVLPVIAAARRPDPQVCLDNQLPTMKAFKRREANCSSLFSDVKCAGYTGYDETRKLIVLSIRGSHGVHQYYDLWKIGNQNGTIPFFDVGRVTKVFHDNFESLWFGGLGEDLHHLIKTYPDFEIWVGGQTDIQTDNFFQFQITGYSMGASLALITSAYMALTGMSHPHNMKVILLGCPRCTDYQFAMWHSMNFPYSYHIIHAHDYAPRVPFFDNIDNISLYHPRTEVWYNNEMKEGDGYIICEQADQPFCSSQIQNLSTPDHMHYFNMDITRWADHGCPKNREDFKPIFGTHQRIIFEEEKGNSSPVNYQFVLAVITVLFNFI